MRTIRGLPSTSDGSTIDCDLRRWVILVEDIGSPFERPATPRLRLGESA